MSPTSHSRNTSLYDARLITGCLLKILTALSWNPSMVPLLTVLRSAYPGHPRLALQSWQCDTLSIVENSGITTAERTIACVYRQKRPSSSSSYSRSSNNPSGTSGLHPLSRSRRGTRHPFGYRQTGGLHRQHCIPFSQVKSFQMCSCIVSHNCVYINFNNFFPFLLRAVVVVENELEHTNASFNTDIIKTYRRIEYYRQ